MFINLGDSNDVMARIANVSMTDEAAETLIAQACESASAEIRRIASMIRTSEKSYMMNRDNSGS